MNGDYFTKQIDKGKKPLSGKQRAALLFSLLGRDGFEKLTPYLTDKEVQQLRKALKSIEKRIDVTEDVDVLESLEKFGQATNLWPQKKSAFQAYAKTYFEEQGSYQEPSADTGLEKMGLKSEDIARVLSVWLQDEE